MTKVEEWERRRKVANAIENTGQTVGGTAGALVGVAALRDVAVRDHPKKAIPMLARNGARFGPKAAHAAVAGKPGLKTIGAVVLGGATAAAARGPRKISEKKVKRYSQVSKAAFDEPGGLMHAGDIAKGMIRPDNNETSLKRHKKVQGTLGTTAAVTGLAAAGAKLAPKVAGKLPKIMRNVGAVGGRGGSYQKHLDSTADKLLFAGAGIGGASGIHQSQIMGAEGAMRKQPVKKNAKKKAVALAVGAGVGTGSYYALRNPTGEDTPRPIGERTGRTAKRAVKVAVAAKKAQPGVTSSIRRTSGDVKRGYQSL